VVLTTSAYWCVSSFKKSFEAYPAEREKRIREEKLAEEQRVKNANREISSVETNGDTPEGDTDDTTKPATSEMNYLEN
jgi:hypothetical protein